jgi:hypothetical protein
MTLINALAQMAFDNFISVLLVSSLATKEARNDLVPLKMTRMVSVCVCVPSKGSDIDNVRYKNILVSVSNIDHTCRSPARMLVLSSPRLRLLSMTESVALPPDPSECITVPKSHSSRMIEQSRCPKCEIRMMLVRVERSYAGPDLRTLKCPKCELASIVWIP